MTLLGAQDGAFVAVSDFDRLGHRWTGLVNVRVSVPPPGQGEDAVASLAQRLDDALGASPRVEGHALFRSLFLGSWGTGEVGSPVRIAGATEPMANERVPRHSMAVGPGYFELHEIPLLAGRGIAGFLQKPYGMEDLGAVLEAVLNGRPAPPVRAD